MSDIEAIGSWANNAELIDDIVTIHADRGWSFLDVTYGGGKFWKKWMPRSFVASDLDRDLSPYGKSVDFRNQPWEDKGFDVVVFDPPYRYAGTATNHNGIDDRYGINEYKTPDEIDALLRDGLRECCRVAKRQVWVKCADQVVAGKLRLQTVPLINLAESSGFRLRDHAMLRAGRIQPPNRKQKHLRRRYSSLLIFQRTGRI